MLKDRKERKLQPPAIPNDIPNGMKIAYTSPLALNKNDKNP